MIVRRFVFILFPWGDSVCMADETTPLKKRRTGNSEGPNCSAYLQDDHRTCPVLLVSVCHKNRDDPDVSFLHRLLKHCLLHVQQCLIAYLIPCMQFLLQCEFLVNTCQVEPHGPLCQLFFTDAQHRRCPFHLPFELLCIVFFILPPYQKHLYPTSSVSPKAYPATNVYFAW